jgi:predicted transcriptional regulator
MNVLLSIKPEFANKIFSGIKKFEFRRSIFKRTDIEKIIVYASAPISMVIGEFQIDNILHEELPALWNLTKKYAGITEDYFYKYFSDKNVGYAIKIKSSKKYETPYSIKTKYGITPPQSFMYIE